MALFPETRNKAYIRLTMIVSLVLFLFLAGAIYFFSSDNLVGGIVFLVIPFPIIFLFSIFARPTVGFISVLFANYFAVGLGRYLPGPLGLSVDGILLLTWIAVLFSQFNKKVEWKKASNEFTLFALLWFGYTLFELVNPEARSKEAWFYAMRGVSLYIVLTVPLVYILFNTKKNFELFIKLTAWFTLFGVFKGLMQKFIGPDPWEQIWLRDIGGKTHLLAGGLRVFSFFSDSATYGGSMGFSSVLFTVIGIHTENKRTKAFYITVGMLALFAMFISGTRGALAVPLSGFTLYAILTKRVKILFTGVFIIALFFGLLKFTTIGNSNYEIRRFRGGLDANNDSFQVRVENRKKFKQYLSSRPFGGGIGSAGNWGLRFTPGTFLAETPPDGWYIQVWAEQGIVGLSLYLGLLVFIIGKCSFLIFFRLKDEENRSKAMAITAGFFGIMAASYSSSALGQMPNLIILFTGATFVFIMPEWEKEAEAQKELAGSSHALNENN